MVLLTIKGFKMSKKIKQNVIWVDFKSKRIIDLSEFGRPAKPTQPIPYLCQIRDKHLLKVGRQ
jgi:hypothetical protein